MVGLVPDGLERYNIFLNSNVLYPKLTVCFLLLVSVSGEIKIFVLKNMIKILIKELKWYVRFLFPKKISIIFLTLLFHYLYSIYPIIFIILY